MGEMGVIDGRKEGRRKENCSVFTDFTFLALLTGL